MTTSNMVFIFGIHGKITFEREIRLNCIENNSLEGEIWDEMRTLSQTADCEMSEVAQILVSKFLDLRNRGEVVMSRMAKRVVDAVDDGVRDVLVNEYLKFWVDEI
ncbi:hypothetical protein HK096_000801, partial [Nowakowskiella sp. JEL0078]